MVTKDDDVIEVCSEETLNEILDRYMELNEGGVFGLLFRQSFGTHRHLSLLLGTNRDPREPEACYQWTAGGSLFTREAGLLFSG